MKAKKPKNFDTSVNSDPVINALGEKKIKALNYAGNIHVFQQMWMIVNVCELSKSLEDVSCPECRENRLSYSICVGENVVM